jgi:hypothetical protein
LKRIEAVHYLIKGLRHKASRSYGTVTADLASITGLNFGTDFKKWHEWWATGHPSNGFDFDHDLGK